MKQIYLIGIVFSFIILLQSCSEPVAPSNETTIVYSLNENDYLSGTLGYFNAIKICDDITKEVIDFGSVTVSWQSYNTGNIVSLPQTYTLSNNLIITSSYTFYRGQIIFHTRTTDVNNYELPFTCTGNFTVTITKRK